MRFLLDQDVYASTTQLLRTLGHEVITAAEIGGSRMADVVLLDTAQKQGCILVTRDRDFGELVFVQGMRVGVMYLRVLPSTLHTCHQELATVLHSYSETELQHTFVVIEPGRHRVRRLSQ